jgi:hypothetical protein
MSSVLLQLVWTVIRNVLALTCCPSFKVPVYLNLNFILSNTTAGAPISDRFGQLLTQCLLRASAVKNIAHFQNLNNLAKLAPKSQSNPYIRPLLIPATLGITNWDLAGCDPLGNADMAS